MKAVRLLGAPARFEASKLKVVLTREVDVNNKYAGVIPRTYILSHCDFTANLTLTISHVINFEQVFTYTYVDIYIYIYICLFQLCTFIRNHHLTLIILLFGMALPWQLRGWYSKDDVVAEWKKVNGDMCLHVHCFVSGPNLLSELAAELRYQIFSKELPLVSVSSCVVIAGLA